MTSPILANAYRSAHISPPRQPSPHAIQIELDKPAASYAAAEPIRGRVVVTPAFDQQCEKLAIELQLHADGTVRSVGVAAHQQLFSGWLRAGVPVSFPFAIEAPRTAGPYRGRLFQLGLRLAAVLIMTPTEPEPKGLVASLFAGMSRHELTARAYPAAARPIAIAGDPRPLVVTVHPERARAALADRGLKVAIGFIMLLLSFAALVVTAAMLLDVLSVGSPLIALGPGGGAVLFGAIGLGVLVQNLGAWMAERKIGTPDIAVRSVGPVLQIAVRLAPQTAVSGVSVTLKALEQTNIPEPDSTTTREHPIAEQRVTLAGGTEPGLFVGELPISALTGMPPTIGLPAARVIWRLQLRVALPLWPDWQDAVPLDAYPGGDRPSTRAEYVLTFD